MTEKKTDNWHGRSFFGVHYDLHAGAGDTCLGEACTYEHIREELEKVRPDFVQYDCKGHPGYAGYPTRVGTPSPGIKRDALKVWRQVTRDMAIPLSVHYSGVFDEVAGQKHPDWQRQDAEGNPHKGRMCCNGPYVDELMIPQLLEVIQWYDVDGFWIDGDNWATTICYCDRCRSLFARESGCAEPPVSRGGEMWAEWMAFQRRSFERYVTRYANAVHNAKPACLVCSNWSYSVRQPDEISAPVDYLSGDFAPAFGLESTALEARFLDSRHVTWDLMAWTFFRMGDRPHSTKTPDHLKQDVAVVLACGGNVFLYDQPRRDGHLIGWHQDLEAEVARFVREREPVCARSRSVPQVALLHSQSHYYANTNQAPYGGANEGATAPLQGALQALLENHYHVDVMNEDELRRRLNEYNLLVVAEQTSLPPRLVSDIVQYVRAGGRLLVTGAETVRLFRDVLGLSFEGEASERTFCLPADGEAVTVRGNWQVIRCESARELLPLMKSEEVAEAPAPVPSAAVNEIGKGIAGAVPGPVFEAYNSTHYPRLRTFVRDVLKEVAGPQQVQLEGPPCVHVAVREKEGKTIVHLVNLSTGHPLSPTNAAVEAVPEVGPLTLRVRCPHQPKTVRLVPEREGLQWQWADGRLTVRIGAVRIHSALVIE